MPPAACCTAQIYAPRQQASLLDEAPALAQRPGRPARRLTSRPCRDRLYTSEHPPPILRHDCFIIFVVALECLNELARLPVRLILVMLIPVEVGGAQHYTVNLCPDLNALPDCAGNCRLCRLVAIAAISDELATRAEGKHRDLELAGFCNCC